MATLDKLSTLKVLLSDDTVVLPNDDALNVYLNIAEQKILNRLYPFTTDYSELTVPDKYAFLQCQVAEYIINKRGAEGELSHNENGINRTYESADIPKSLLSKVKMEGARIYVSLDNFITLTDYSGYDPEFSYSSSPSSGAYGADFGEQATLKSVIVGASFNF